MEPAPDKDVLGCDVGSPWDPSCEGAQPSLAANAAGKCPNGTCLSDGDAEQLYLMFGFFAAFIVSHASKPTIAWAWRARVVYSDVVGFCCHCNAMRELRICGISCPYSTESIHLDLN